MNKRTKRWVAGLVAAGLIMAPGSLAWYGDVETSSDNVFGAAILDMILLDSSDTVLAGLVFDEDDFGPGDSQSQSQSLKIKNVGSLDFRYKGVFAKTSGDLALCGNLQVEAQLNGGVVYTGPLVRFNENPAGMLVPGASDTWDFEISLDDGGADLQELSCEFDWVFMAWQTDSDGTWGFTDTEEAGNEIGTGSWAPAEGDVVINEVMWMGSDGKPNDEWIELRNMTGSDIDIVDWTINNAKSAGATLEITDTSTILPANGFLLIARHDEDSGDSDLNVPVDVVNSSLSLANSSNGNLVLRDSYGNLVDEAQGDTWPVGVNGGPEWKSMERNDTPGDGTNAGAWHTCIDAGCDDGTFWDTADGDNFGTPGAANLSENDPTSEDYTGPPAEDESEEDVPVSLVVDEMADGNLPDGVVPDEDGDVVGEEDDPTDSTGDLEDGEGSGEEGPATGEEGATGDGEGSTEGAEGSIGEEGTTEGEGTTDGGDEEGTESGDGESEGDPTTLAEGELRGAGSGSEEGGESDGGSEEEGSSDDGGGEEESSGDDGGGEESSTDTAPEGGSDE